MKNPTFRGQYDKIVGAYLRNELMPFTSCACFIGNMLNGKYLWRKYKALPSIDSFKQSKYCLKEEANGFYTLTEIYKLQAIFLNALIYNRSYTEQSLFTAMEISLQALKKLHESKGEIIEDYVFNKRKLAV